MSTNITVTQLKCPPVQRTNAATGAPTYNFAALRPGTDDCILLQDVTKDMLDPAKAVQKALSRLSSAKSTYVKNGGKGTFRIRKVLAEVGADGRQVVHVGCWRLADPVVAEPAPAAGADGQPAA